MPIRSATATQSIRSWRVEQYASSSSSSQFFMNRPTTSKPARFNSSAATAESTPPDMPTTTFSLLDIWSFPGEPVLEREHPCRLAVVEKPAVNDIDPLRFPLAHARGPVLEHEETPAHQRLRHFVEPEPAARLQQSEESAGVGRM